MSRRGVFITLEGPDGSGKSTQLKMLGKALKQKGFPVLLTREPGGSKGAVRIRKLLLDAKGSLAPATELLLFLADRAQHVADTLLPALKQGKVVLCDRYVDSTLAYQGAGRGFSSKALAELNRFATGGLKPLCTLLFDLEAGGGLKRATQRRAKDRMEAAGAAFHRRVRQGFLRLARAEKRRFRVIRVAGKSRAEVLSEGLELLKGIL